MAKAIPYILAPLASLIDKDFGKAVAAVGLVAIGAATGNFALISAGVAYGSTAFAKTPKVPQSQTDRLTASIDPRAFRKEVLGQTAFPVDVRYEEWSGKDQETCDWIVCFASHAIDGLEEVWFDTEMAWSATTGVVGKYAGYFSIPHLVLEGSPSAAFSIGAGRWNGSTRLTGCAYANFRFKVTGNSKKATSPFASGIPTRITAIGRGAKLYDPRRDSSVPGGNGPMRWNDQSTWRFTADDGVVIGENLALHVLRRVLGWRIKNPASGEMRLATGSGVPARRLDLQSFIVAANLADEAVNRSAGGTEPRYHGAAVISEGDDPKTTLDMLCAACCGRFRDTGGRLSLVIAHNDLGAAATEEGLLDDDVIGAFTWDPDPSLEVTPNVVRGRYVDATSASLYQLIDYPEVRLPSPDGQDRFYPLDLGAVESPSQAQRVARQALQRLQYQRTFSAPFDIRAWKYPVGSIVPFTFAPLGFVRVLFRVAEQELGQDGSCVMTLKIEHASIYAWDANDSAAVIGAEPIVYDSRNNPIILAIGEAGTTADWEGVTGANKPADNATNSADPASPFGPGGTVGGTIDRLGTFDQALAREKARQDALEQETIPAIDAAVADAGERITAARGRADAAYAQADKAISDADKVNKRVDSIVAEGGYDDRDVRAEIKRVDETAVSRDQAIGRRVDTVEATFTGAGGNLVPNTALSTLDGWFFSDVAGGGEMSLDRAGTPWRIGGVEHNLTLFNSADKGNGIYSEAYSAPFAVRPGSSIQFYAYAMSHRATHWVSLMWLKADGTPTTEYYAGEYPGARFNEGGANIASWEITGSKAVVVPASAVAAKLMLRQYASTRETDRYSWFTRPFVSEVKAGTTAWVPYSAGNDRPVSAAAAAKITQASTTAANAAQAVADLSTSVTTRFGAVNGTLASYDQRITTLSSGQEAFGGRLTTLESSISGAGGILARIQASEQTLADLPNRYAAASRTSTLEAQLARTSPSAMNDAVNYVNGRIDTVNNGTVIALNARIEDRATAIADAKSGAVAQTVQTLRSEYDGTKATVTQQAGTLAAVGGKTAAYVKIVADAGGGRAALSLWSDQYGSAWALTGDGLITGNLTVDGSLTVRKLNRGTMTAFTTSSVGGTHSLGYTSSQALQTYYVPNLGADMAIGDGGSLFVSFSGNASTTGNPADAPEVYPSIDLFDPGSGALLQSIRLPLQGYGSSGRLDNNLTRIVNTLGERTVRWRLAVRARRPSGQGYDAVSNSVFQPVVTFSWSAL